MGKGYLRSISTCPRCGVKEKRPLHPLEVKFVNSSLDNPFSFWDGIKLYVISELQMWFGSKFTCGNCGKSWRA